MGVKLFGFIYKTLQKRANDPGSRTYWLPGALQKLEKPDGGMLLPLQGTDWNLGEITGSAGTLFQNTIKGQWWLKLGRDHRGDPEMKKHQPIACPDRPWPRLAMPEVTVYGLDNVLLLDQPLTTQPGTGYRTVLTLQFGYYDGQQGRPSLAPIHLEGRYALNQCVCSAPAAGPGNPPPTACDGWIPDDDIQGTGSFRMTMTGLYADAVVNVQVDGSGAERSLALTVSDITVRGSDGSLPALAVDELTLDTSMTWIADNVWLPKAKDALTSEDGRRALLLNLSAALNQPHNLAALQQTLAKHFNRMLDSTLGTVPAGMLPSSGPAVNNPADQYLFDRVRASLNQPASDYFMPKVVTRNTDPMLEPFQADVIRLGDQSVEGLLFRNLQLHQVVIAGLSNMAAPTDSLLLQEDALDGTLLISTLNPPPVVTFIRGGTSVEQTVPGPPLILTGQFTMEPDGMEEELGGSLRIEVDRSSVRSVMAASGDELGELELRFTTLLLDAATADIRVRIDIDSEFRDLINEMFNQSEIKSKALQGINDAAAQNLDAIGRAATDGAKKAIAARLDA